MLIRMQVHNYVTVQLNGKNMDQLEFLIKETNFRVNADDSVTKREIILILSIESKKTASIGIFLL